MTLPDPPADLDLTETRVPEILGTLATTWCLAVIAIALRVVARRLKGNPLWVEDWLVFVSIVASSIHFLSTALYMIPHGTGRHVWVAPAEATKVWASGLFIAEIVYTITIVTVKWSTLSFYWRIFAANPSIRIPIWILFGIVSAWGTAVILITVFQCTPPHAFWQRFDPISPLKTTEFTCGVDTNNFFIGNSIPNVITDTLIVFLPLPLVWKLQLPVAQRLALVGIFMLGTFVTIVSGVRLIYILRVDVKSPDITWNFADSIIWTNVEANMAIVGCCLPSLKPILNLVLNGTLRTGSHSRGTDLNKSGNTANADHRLKSNPTHSAYMMNSNNHTSISKAGKGDDDEHPFARLSDNDSSSWHGDSGNALQLNSLNKTGGITITKQVRIDRTDRVRE